MARVTIPVPRTDADMPYPGLDGEPAAAAARRPAVGRHRRAAVGPLSPAGEVVRGGSAGAGGVHVPARSGGGRRAAAAATGIRPTGRLGPGPHAAAVHAGGDGVGDHGSAAARPPGGGSPADEAAAGAGTASGTGAFPAARTGGTAGPPRSDGGAASGGLIPGGAVTMTAREVVSQYWAAMNANDWAAAAQLFAEGYVCRWPQSQELIRGRDVWVVVQANFPTPSPWRFTVERLVAEAATVVSEVTVANSEARWRCVQFTEVADGLIAEQTEYWPEELGAPAWRAGWAERVPRAW